MLLKETIAQGWESLMRNRLRSALTMLGIIWGLVCVVLLLAYGEGVASTVAYATGNMSEGVLVMWPGQTSMQAGGQRAGRKVAFEYDDVEAIRAEVPLAKGVSAEATESLPIKRGTRVVSVMTRAVELPYCTMRKINNMEEGRCFNEADFADHRRVVVLGNGAAKKIFQGMPAEGQSVAINGLTFEVIGVLKVKIQDSMYQGPDDDHAFIPFPLFRDLLSVKDPEIIVVQPLDPALHERTLQAARAVLARRHHFDPKDEKAVPTWDTVESSAMVRSFGVALQVVLGLIGALTLGVGGVGVMNIMLVSVTERTREIGLRKSLGARPRDILKQFLLEALVLTFVGGVLGVLVSLALTHLIPPMPLYGSMYETANNEGDLVLRMSGSVAMASFLILAVVGVVSGFWPALKASRMHPIEALRYE